MPGSVFPEDVPCVIFSKCFGFYYGLVQFFKECMVSQLIFSNHHSDGLHLVTVALLCELAVCLDGHLFQLDVFLDAL